LSHPPDHYYWLLFSRPRLADRPPQGVLYLLPHVWRKRGIGKELHLVSNADAAGASKSNCRQTWTLVSGQDVGNAFSTSPGTARTSIVCAQRTSAFVERFASAPAIRDSVRTRI